MMQLLYVQTSGIDTPERLYAPFVLGTTARAMGIEVSIFFMIKGIMVMKTGEAERVQLGTFPPLSEVRDQAIAAEVRCYVCEQSAGLLGIAKGDFVPAATIAGAATLNDLALEADAVISF
jgi:predicted peroxiredoxin